MALFTAENAAIMGKAGAMARWNAPEQAPMAELIAEPVISLELSRVRSRLDKLNELMEKARDSDEWDSLSRAYERIFKAWVHLAGIPGPGNRKPSDKPPRHVQTIPEPTPIQPVVVKPSEPEPPKPESA